MTKQEYEKRILEMYGNDFILVSEVEDVKNRDTIQVKCSICDTTFTINARTFVRKDKGLTLCGNCKKNKRENKEKERVEKSKNWFLTKEKVQENIISKLKVIEVKDNSHVTVECNDCHNVYTTSYVNFKKAKDCKFCANRVKLSIDDYQKKLDDKYPNEYEVLDQTNSEYAYYSKNKPTVLHKACNHITTKDINEILKYGCSYCGKTCKNLYKDLVKRVILETKNQYKILTNESNYKSMKIPVEMIHTKCGNKWNVTLDNFLNKGTRCPKCNSLIIFSKQSKVVFKVLNNQNIYFRKEIRYKQIGRKRFDILLVNSKILIEIDGLQHFEPSFEEESFLRTSKNDQLKNNFCKDTKKDLIRIPYNFDLNKLSDLFSDLTLTNIQNFPEVFFIKDGIEFHKEKYYAPVNQELKRLQKELVD